MADTYTQSSAYFHADDCSLAEFETLVEQRLDPARLQFTDQVQHNIPIYDITSLRDDLADGQRRVSLMAEWGHILGQSAGILVLKHAYADTAAIDQASTIYEKVIAREKEQVGGGADHFATAGNNDRVWNSLQKLCEASPAVFADYFANPAIDAACEAWLGPNYQMTAQINLVRPGGQAQQAHRDYHLGFQTADGAAKYPAHVHDLSPALTLQGAIAHVDMPIESGPTKLLPFSQMYRPGYTAWRREDFRAYFEKNYVQMPLEKGDVLFFNPALFHAAGANTSQDIQRMGNLVQVSSAFGRSLENINREKMCRLIYPHLLENRDLYSAAELTAIIAASAEGYSFPTNLDLDPPVGGLAPETQNELMHRALAEDMPPEAFYKALEQQSEKKQA